MFIYENAEMKTVLLNKFIFLSNFQTKHEQK